MIATPRQLIIPSAEPFFFPAGRAACLLVHGFTGTPKEMRWMGEHLHRAGFTVLGVRLAGHATAMHDLPRMRWRDWLASVEDGWHLLRSGGYHPIVIMGLSLGGVLSLVFSARFPVAGVVSMSAPYRLPPHPLLPFLRPLSFVRPYLPKGPSDARDREALKEHISYPANPTRGLLEVRNLLRVLRAELPGVQVPALIVHSRSDRYVPPENAEHIFAALGSHEKDLLWVENSGHVIPREPERERVFQAATAFARRVCGLGDAQQENA